MTRFFQKPGRSAPYFERASPGEGPRGNLRAPAGGSYQSPRTFHQMNPAPIQTTMLTNEMTRPSFHQVLRSR
jgi:hypothetical protein